MRVPAGAEHRGSRSLPRCAVRGLLCVFAVPCVCVFTDVCAHRCEARVCVCASDHQQLWDMCTCGAVSVGRKSLQSTRTRGWTRVCASGCTVCPGLCALDLWCSVCSWSCVQEQLCSCMWCGILACGLSCRTGEAEVGRPGPGGCPSAWCLHSRLLCRPHCGSDAPGSPPALRPDPLRLLPG